MNLLAFLLAVAATTMAIVATTTAATAIHDGPRHSNPNPLRPRSSATTGTATVTCLVFAATENPTFPLSADETATLLRIATAGSANPETPSTTNGTTTITDSSTAPPMFATLSVGYQGWLVRFPKSIVDPNGPTGTGAAALRWIVGQTDLEMLLLDAMIRFRNARTIPSSHESSSSSSSSELLASITPSVVDHIRTRILSIRDGRLSSSCSTTTTNANAHDDDLRGVARPRSLSDWMKALMVEEICPPAFGFPIATDVTGGGSNDNCGHTPIRGPNTPPVFDVETDDGGCFEERQSDNNCYNYGTDILTNTFAQPGRGTGHKWDDNTCDLVGAAAVRDGLTLYGTSLPTEFPTIGHYVALFIWPDTNFHWVRQDANHLWSHKPGGTPVRNTDNTGKKIVDPANSDFSPWSQFCAYYIVVPSNATIS